MNTYYTHGEVDYNGLSIHKYEDQESAVEGCIDRMKRAKAQGYTVTDQAIIRVDTHTIRDEFYVLLTQETRTTVEIVNRNCAEGGN